MTTEVAWGKAMLGTWKIVSSGTRLAALLLAVGVSAAATSASAHSFLVEIRAAGDDKSQVLTSAVQGFLIATAERDGHAAQDSNGHLGGLDVYFLPAPAEVAISVVGLKPAPYSRADILVVIGAPELVARVIADAQTGAVEMPSGTLPDERIWSEETATDKSFAARYRAAYGGPPDRWAAEGYDAARRIDLAIRPLGAVEDAAALVRALRSSAGGISW